MTDRTVLKRREQAIDHGANGCNVVKQQIRAALQSGGKLSELERT